MIKENTINSNRSDFMKLQGLAIVLLLVTMTGCSSSFWGGAGAGVLGAGAGYEIQAQRQMDQLRADLKSGKIDQKEYDIRRDQIEKGSLLK